MGQYTQAIAITVAAVLVFIALIGLGWRNRLRRQSGIAPLPQAPADLPPSRSFEGQYVCTTTADDWLDRIAVHSLGLRTNAGVRVFAAGVLIERDGAAPVFIAADALRGVGRSSGMAGKFVEKDGLLVLTWMLGDKAVDTGFRPRYHQEMKELAELAGALLEPAAEPTGPDAAGEPDFTVTAESAGTTDATPQDTAIENSAPGATPAAPPTDSPAAEKENQ
ncbi:hypothetical protein [Paeniglutamicibacter cryotolerans]|uniref:PH domain-containing protein n=1 Tax=Paeniglutamicibacter cryotolerans TaxID=670079 RepID=A0A839QYW1_9MICC|nr:hypothetical protein [Paeniglutamicibacter cryotolerans]MBB2997151.1 hypothetical protein [Paeniglutamicibacter cryotolerans]